jgi:predicted transcriptional regulator
MSPTDTMQRGRPLAPVETAEQRAERLERERAMLAVGEEDLAAGRYLEGEEAEAWLDAWVRGEEVAVSDAPRAPKR